MNKKIAVLLPCYNEELSVKQTVEGFKAAVPHATIYVGDNNSKDKTAQLAREAGAVLIPVPQKGKGNVIKKLFANVEADIYIMCDGDITYEPKAAMPAVQKLTAEGLDYINIARGGGGEQEYRAGHRFGNRMLTGFVNFLFKGNIQDMLSGYKVMSRRFVKSFPCFSQGFEIETELAVHCLSLDVNRAEVEAPYYARPEGSASKLNTYKDGFRILRTIFMLVKDEKPMMFFSAIALFFAALSLGFAEPVLVEFLKTQTVPRFPTLIFSTGLMMCAMLSFVCALILDSLTKINKKNIKLAYLQNEGPKE